MSADAAVAEVPFSDLQRRLGVPQRRLPLQGTLETTFRCNLNCVHCYVNEPAGSPRGARRASCRWRGSKALIDEIVGGGLPGAAPHRRRGPGAARLPGALPLRDPQRPAGHGLHQRHAGHGADRGSLRPSTGPHAVEITLYGMTRETYERVTRVPGSYDKCLAGIERLVRARHPAQRSRPWRSPGTSTRCRPWRPTRAAWGCPSSSTASSTRASTAGRTATASCSSRAEQALALDLDEPGAHARPARSSASASCAARARSSSTEYVYTCGAGHTSFTVDPYGQLQMCQLSRRNAFDLRADSFARGWNEHFPELRARKWQTHSMCRTCNLDLAVRELRGRGRAGDGDIEGRRTAVLRDRAPAGLGGHGRGLRPSPRRHLLPGPRLAGGAACPRRSRRWLRVAAAPAAEPSRPALIQIQRPVQR